ncbi:hypothetical protein Tco_1191294 [Tanacetum coccineum]
MINTAYPLPLDTAYRSSGTETNSKFSIFDFRAEFFCLSSEQILLIAYPLHFKSLSLDELRSPNFNLFSDQEYSKEEEAESMAETMEQYMSKTRTDYGSGVASGSDNEDVNEHIEKVLEIVDLFHVPNITEDQLMLRVFPISLTGAKMKEINNFQQEPDETLYQVWEHFKELLMKCPQHYLTEIQEVILFYNGLDVPTRQILDSIDAIPTKTVADAKKAIQEMAEYS